MQINSKLYKGVWINMLKVDIGLSCLTVWADFGRYNSYSKSIFMFDSGFIIAKTPNKSYSLKFDCIYDYLGTKSIWICIKVLEIGNYNKVFWYWIWISITDHWS